MKKLILSFGLCASGFAMAFSPDSITGLENEMNSLFSEQSEFHHDHHQGERGQDHHNGHGRGHRRGERRGKRKQDCGKIAWHHASPTAAQNDSAKQILVAAFETVKAGLPAVKTAFGEVHKALVKHPISKAEVNTAVEGVKTVGEPLRQTVQDAKIDVINLLSAEQRAVFNQVYARCSHQQ